MKLIIPLVLIIVLNACKVSTEAVFSTSKGAIAGFDPVSYFSNDEPLKGSVAYTYIWNGAKWYFVTDENRKAFKSMPEIYAPQYGGYCAYAVSQGYTAKIDPKCWKIVANKLYLNYDSETQTEWEKNPFEYIMYADANWPKIIESKRQKGYFSSKKK